MDRRACYPVVVVALLAIAGAGACKREPAAGGAQMGTERAAATVATANQEKAVTERAIRLEIEVAAPRSAVWQTWTTSEGVRTFFAPDARIEARPGGAYELYFMPEAPEGSRGSEGCTVVSLAPEERLEVTWNFPPTIPSIRDAHTQWNVVLESLGPERTRVRMTHNHWREGADWDEGFAYFQRAWKLVLSRLQRRFEHGPIDWNDPAH